MSDSYLHAALKVEPRNGSERERMDLHVLIRLAHHANKNGVAWPSERTVSEKMPLERGALRLSLLRLVQDGRIRRLTDQEEITRLAPERKGASAVYLLLLDVEARESAASSHQTVLDAPGVEVGAERPAAGCRRPPDPIKEHITRTSERPRVDAEGAQSAQEEAESTRPAAKSIQDGRDPTIRKLEMRRSAIPALRDFRGAYLGESFEEYRQAQEEVCARWDERHARDSNTIPDALRASPRPPGPQRVGDHLRRAARTAPPLRRAAAGHVTVTYTKDAEELSEAPEAPLLSRLRTLIQDGQQLLMEFEQQTAGAS